MRWIAKEKADQEAVQQLISELGAPPIVAEILCQRGVDTADKVKSFFNPRINDLHDPFLMKDMEKAVLRIEAAIENKENVMIFGDYDVDGTTSVALCYSYFSPLFHFTEYYIPDRYTEGYGISKKGIEYAKEQGMTLIIALDCGIRSVDLVAYAKSLGIDFIICDHHLPGEELPDAVAVLDPKQNDCEYPFKELAGCGIGFKLAEAYAQKNDIDPKLHYQYLDLVCLSIASDIVPVTGENRILAHYGLKMINQSPSVGVGALRSIAVQKEELGIGDLVFYLGPRINAAGRMGHAKGAVELLICKDWDEAVELAKGLSGQNEDRREVDKQITSDLKAIVQEHPELLDRKTLVFYKQDWHKGVVGIAASRAIELYYRPTIILTESNGMLTGSARSISGFDVHEALMECSEYLEQFGGHKYAAGMSLKPENLNEFRQAFEKVGQSKLSDEDLIPKLHYDLEIDLQQINDKLLKVIQKMGPFGPSNLTPVFRVAGVNDDGWGKIIGKTQEHIRLNLTAEGEKIAAVGFGMADKWSDIKKADSLEACFTIQENIFNGNRSIQLMLKDIRTLTYGNDGVSSETV